MPSKKSKMTQAEIRKFRSDVAALKKHGLTKVDARKQKPTRHMKNQIKKYRDVLAGEAQVVTVPSAKIARSYEGRLEHKYNKVIVPKISGVNGKPHYNKSVGDIVTTETYSGAKLIARYGELSWDELKKFDGKPGYYFSVVIQRGAAYEIYRNQRLEELEMIFTRSSWRNFTNWVKYVRVEKVVRGKTKFKELFPDDMEDDEE